MLPKYRKKKTATLASGVADVYEKKLKADNLIGLAGNTCPTVGFKLWIRKSRIIRIHLDPITLAIING